MAIRFTRLFGFAMVVAATLALAGCGGILPKNSNLRAQQSLKQGTVDKLKSMGSSPGAPMVIRVYKETNEFEVWKRTTTGAFKLFKSYEICAYSGTYGPKIKEGDRQAPEGFYNITPGLMNPNSNYYLAFDTGFPNKFDRANGRTGSNLMVHGDCSSRGCYSMTDEAIAEIYALVRESFAGGNAVVQMQIYPFRMTPQNLARYHDNPNISFWMTIKEGYDRFELSKTPPSWDVCEKKYVFDLTGPNGALDATGACPVRGNDPLLASLQAKQSADDAAYQTAVAAIEGKAAQQAAAAQAAAEAEAAAKERGNAIGGFFSGMFGGGQATPTSTSGTTTAPTPMPSPPPGV